MGSKVLINDRRSGTGSPWLTRTVDARQRARWSESATITCRSCHYDNLLSQAFFVLGIQHLYCRRCGRMIDRQGKLAATS
jgi:hypothetical protein